MIKIGGGQEKVQKGFPRQAEALETLSVNIEAHIK